MQTMMSVSALPHRSEQSRRSFLAGRAPASRELAVPGLEEVFLAHRVHLRAIAQKILGASDVADDVVQDSYLRIAQASVASHVEKPFSYCCQVVRNVALDFCRRCSVELSYRSYVEGGEPPQVAGGASPEQDLDEQRALDAIDRTLKAMPSRTRRAFELYCLGGLTQREIGERLGCSATLINFMVRDVRDALSASLAP